MNKANLIQCWKLAKALASPEGTWTERLWEEGKELVHGASWDLQSIKQKFILWIRTLALSNQLCNLEYGPHSPSLRFPMCRMQTGSPSTKMSREWGQGWVRAAGVVVDEEHTRSTSMVLAQCLPRPLTVPTLSAQLPWARSWLHVLATGTHAVVAPLSLCTKCYHAPAHSGVCTGHLWGARPSREASVTSQPLPGSAWLCSRWWQTCSEAPGGDPAWGDRRLLHAALKTIMDKPALMDGINLQTAGLTLHMLSKSLMPDDTNLLFLKTGEL